MNARQRKFCEVYAAEPNATAAAIAAGYSPKTARNIGAENLTKPDIKDYIRQLQAAAEGERIASIKEIKAFWTMLLRDEECKIDSRLKASELLARSAAAFTDKLDLQAQIEAEVKDVIFYIPDNGRPFTVDLEGSE